MLIILDSFPYSKPRYVVHNMTDIVRSSTTSAASAPSSIEFPNDSDPECNFEQAWSTDIENVDLDEFKVTTLGTIEKKMCLVLCHTAQNGEAQKTIPSKAINYQESICSAP